MTKKFNIFQFNNLFFSLFFSLQPLSVLPSLSPALSGQDLFMSGAASPFTPVTLDASFGAGFLDIGTDSPQQASLFSDAISSGCCREASREFSSLEFDLFNLTMATGTPDPMSASLLLKRVEAFSGRNATLIASNGLFSDDSSSSSADKFNGLLERAKSVAAMHGVIIASVGATGKAE